MRQEASSGVAQGKQPGESWLTHLFRAGHFSLSGLGATFRHEVAFRIEVSIFLVSLPIVILLPVGLMLKALLVASMLFVLIVELLNSSLEWIVDYISLEQHPYAKRAKDMGSAAVLLASINSGLFWLLALAQAFGGVPSS
jgi:diacylglycerol kinase (ATP)